MEEKKILALSISPYAQKGRKKKKKKVAERYVYKGINGLSFGVRFL